MIADDYADEILNLLGICKPGISESTTEFMRYEDTRKAVASVITDACNDMKQEWFYMSSKKNRKEEGKKTRDWFAGTCSGIIWALLETNTSPETSTLILMKWSNEMRNSYGDEAFRGAVFMVKKHLDDMTMCGVKAYAVFGRSVNSLFNQMMAECN